MLNQCPFKRGTQTKNEPTKRNNPTQTLSPHLGPLLLPELDLSVDQLLPPAGLLLQPLLQVLPSPPLLVKRLLPHLHLLLLEGIISMAGCVRRDPNVPDVVAPPGDYDARKHGLNTLVQSIHQMVYIVDVCD